VKAPKTDTFMETFRLLNENYSVEEIAETRQLHATTIYSHIAHLFSKNIVSSIDNYINQTEYNIVKEATIELGETKQLSPIFQYLKEEIPYHIIRLCLAKLEKEKNE